MQTAHSTGVQYDVRTLNSTLLKLRLPGWLWRAAILFVAVIVWIWICQHILYLGSLIRYDGLEALGPDVVRLLTKINPYVWWGGVAILTLVVLSVARNWLIRSSRHAKTKLVSVAEVHRLSSTLSREGLEVLQWAWDPTVNPVTIEDLLVTRNEIKSGRIRKLAMAQAQKQALEESLAQIESTDPGFSLESRLKTEPIIDMKADRKIEPML